MCGIVGYVGRQNAKEIIIDGLKRLEYRGYDSAGIALLDGEKISVKKCAGRIERLAERMRMSRTAANELTKAPIVT